MLQSFDSLFDLMDAFPDEQSCIDHLRAIRCREGEFCPHCGANRIYHFRDKKTSSVVTAARGFRLKSA